MGKDNGQITEHILALPVAQRQPYLEDLKARDHEGYAMVREMVIYRLYEMALQQPDDHRANWVRQQCGSDHDLRLELGALLNSAADEDDGVLKPLPNQQQARNVLQELGEQSTTPVLPEGLAERFRPVRFLGQGGMGRVFLVEEIQPRRLVALKVIKLGMDSEQVLRRFELEREALARLDSPHIAKIFQAGSTRQGQPYFTMEYSDGQPITHWCDQHRLSLNQRLLLFTEVCEGVHHAHQKGIIHRDLKPSNVLVGGTPDDPRPKIIDFGIARVVSGEEDATVTARVMKTLQHLDMTRPNTAIGTLAYMSPEQARVFDGDVDHTSDIYSLGVLLYELLAGVLPLDERDLSGATWDQLFQLIREREPIRPSARLSGSQDPDEIAARRGLTSARHKQSLRGDLDWIVLKALAKEPTRRYASALDFAHDIQAHLNHLPVMARRPKPGYVLGRYISRHKWQTLLAAALVLSLGLFCLQTWSKHSAMMQEKQKNRETMAYLTQLMNGDHLMAKDHFSDHLLKEAQQRLSADLVDQPLVLADLLATVGRLHVQRGDDEQGISAWKRCLDLRTQHLGAHHPKSNQSRLALIDGLLGAGEWQQAETLVDEALSKQTEDRATLNQKKAEILLKQDKTKAEQWLLDCVDRNERDPIMSYLMLLYYLNKIAAEHEAKGILVRAELIHSQVNQLLSDIDENQLVGGEKKLYYLLTRSPDAQLR